LSSSHKHVGKFTNHFRKAIKTLDINVRNQLYEKIDDMLKGMIIGKSLKGPYKEFKAIRIGRYRLIYSDKEPCIILFYDIRHRESAYI
jgi:mRNA-degrading endonuclease RelE of RelBE toxin-antitoxin system